MSAVIDDRNKPSKPILALDFDGVLHSYTTGWHHEGLVADPPVSGAMEFIFNASDHFEIHVFSSRSATAKARSAMKDWLRYHFTKEMGMRLYARHKLLSIQWPRTKPHAHLIIDDRAMQFTGVWPSIAEIAAFKPWNRK